MPMRGELHSNDYVNAIVCAVLLLPMSNGVYSCDQGQSKVVRTYIVDEVLPVYSEYGVSPPQNCAMYLENDLYDVYERNKYEEGSSKWVCQFCGKAFYEERFLNQHFRNRHPHYLGDSAKSMCLADYCHLFRCQVMVRKQKPHYWDKALCKTSMLEDQKAECEELVRTCIPASLTQEARTLLYEAVHNKVCRYLSCEHYWDLPSPKTPALTVAGYIVAWMFLGLLLFVYYFIACTHFFTDDSVLDPDHRQTVTWDEKLMFFFPQGKKVCTQRIGVKHHKNK